MNCSFLQGTLSRFRLIALPMVFGVMIVLAPQKHPGLTPASGSDSQPNFLLSIFPGKKLENAQNKLSIIRFVFPSAIPLLEVPWTSFLRLDLVMAPCPRNTINHGSAFRCSIGILVRTTALVRRQPRGIHRFESCVPVCLIRQTALCHTLRQIHASKIYKRKIFLSHLFYYLTVVFSSALQLQNSCLQLPLRRPWPHPSFLFSRQA